jgi:hypothetical protein
MKTLLLFILFVFCMFFLGLYIESNTYPYEEGMHWSYSIKCENGFIYKIQNKAAIQILNSDGTPLKCGKKIY